MTDNEQNDVAALVRRFENNYITGTTTIGKYVQFSQYENVEKIDAYLNSKHTSGDMDALDREKPFFNIVTAAVNIWFRATDIDRKNIKIKPAKLGDTVLAFIATIHLQEWMHKTAFGAFLNDWGRSLARYGSSVLKFVEKDGELIPSVIPWNRLISDTVDFENNPKIEVLWLTPAQLRANKSYDQNQVKSLLEAVTARETTGRSKKDNLSNYIKVYELHGELELENLTGDENDEDTFVQQMHVVSFLGKKGKRNEFDDFTLYKGKEEKDPYMLTSLIKEDGRAMAIGAVEHLFEAQWMKNHTVKNVKDYLDIASKLVLQTADGNFVGLNSLNSMENGDIVIHTPNNPLTTVNMTQPSITALQEFGKQWEVLAQEITSTPDSLRGDTAPSGTAWRQVQALQQESHSLFELMVENKGLDIEKMMRTYVFDHLQKQMDTADEISTTLGAYGINQIDSKYIPNEAIRRFNQATKDHLLHPAYTDQATPPAPQFNQQQANQQVQQEVNQQGSQRFFKPSDIPDKTWKEVFNKFKWEAEVDVTGEGTPDKDDMATLSTVLQTIATNPRVLSDPNAKLIFNKILSISGGISPLELVDGQPFVPMPTKTLRETIDYKDVPDDIKRQMEQQEGFEPSKMSSPQPGQIQPQTQLTPQPAPAGQGK